MAVDNFIVPIWTNLTLGIDTHIADNSQHTIKFQLHPWTTIRTSNAQNGLIVIYSIFTFLTNDFFFQPQHHFNTTGKQETSNIQICKPPYLAKLLVLPLQAKLKKFQLILSNKNKTLRNFESEHRNIYHLSFFTLII